MPRPQRNEFPDFRNQQNEVRQLFRTLPRVAGNIAVNFFKDRFRQGGWIDQGFDRWEPRKRSDRQRSSRAILVQSGRLRRSIKILKASATSVTVGTDVPYAQIHNEGGTINHPGGTAYIVKDGKTIWVSNKTAQAAKANGRTMRRTKPHQIRIPQRRFIGKSRLLEKRILAYIERSLNNIN